METINLAYLVSATGNYTNGEDILTTLTSELEKTYGSGKVSVTKDGNTYTISIDGKGDFSIDSNGKVEKVGPPVSYANERIVENSDGTGTTVAEGTKTPKTDKLYIYFEASIEGGTTSISPSVPFEITENGIYEFTITSEVDGEIYTSKHSIIANQYALRAGLEIGNYVTYTPPKNSVTLNTDETGWSQQTLESKNKFRIMNINDDGSVDLIGVIEDGDKQISFKGAQGYNNGVYVLNAKCKELYANEEKGITARSIKLEDITSKFNSTGNDKITSYISERVKNIKQQYNPGLSYIKNIDQTNKTITYGTSYSYYPNTYQYEAGGKIGDTATKGIVEQSDSYNGYGIDGILTNEDKDEDNNIIPQFLQADPLTITFTYSSTSHDENDFTDIRNKTAYNSMFFGVRGTTSYWLASRCVNSDNQYAYFCLRYATNGSIGGSHLYRSRKSDYDENCCVMPIVSLNSDVQIEKGTNDGSSNKPYTVIIK